MTGFLTKINSLRVNLLHVTYCRFFKCILFVFFSLLSTRASAPEFKVFYIMAPQPVDPYQRIINAVVRVESKGDNSAINFIEEATGAFQIRPIRLLDYNQRTGNNYRMEDCYDYQISKKIFLFYSNRIGYPYYESIAKNWNGSGKRTLDYWKKVKQYL
jgi:hypothetical protein